jgi:deazaflavin-dependent oxidoreductase (nitroreductase family)
MDHRYDAPGAGARLFNSALRRLAEAGISIAGSTPIRVRGRRTGAERSVVVNLLTLDGREYLVSPRGNTQWARNVRAAGRLEVGPHRRARTVRATEVGDDAKVVVLQRYLERWYWEVKGHIGGLTPQSTPEQVRSVAPSIPVFEVQPA